MKGRKGEEEGTSRREEEEDGRYNRPSINLGTNGNQATAAQVAYRSDVHPHDEHATQNG